ncbi:MAG: carbon-nitrogen hydrolase family protein [Opitutaceae bacterium]|nr:carbon-nitrogen hydrolase family protein [Opitutaceae bacterium]
MISIRLSLATLLFGAAALTTRSAAPTGSPEPSPAAGPFLRVAAVQMRSTRDVPANVTRITRFLAECAAKGVQIAAFPECAVSGYYADFIPTLSADQLEAAARNVAAACGQHRIAAIVGTPEVRAGKRYNTALIINAQGEILGRYDKAQPITADRGWGCQYGAGPSPVFSIGATRASVIICHDNRFPELARLPVLAGSRVIFYISSEAYVTKEHKMGPYRAQAQAIASENRVYLVHANPPADGLTEGSHGQSRLIDTDGNLIQEASIFREEVLISDLDLSKATAEFALEALDGSLKSWWREGVKRVPLLP